MNFNKILSIDNLSYNTRKQHEGKIYGLLFRYTYKIYSFDDLIIRTQVRLYCSSVGTGVFTDATWMSPDVNAGGGGGTGISTILGN